METGVRVVRGHEPRSAGGLETLEKARMNFLPGPRRNTALPTFIGGFSPPEL